MRIFQLPALAFGAMLLPCTVFAQEATANSFDDALGLYHEMTPDQRAHVDAQARIYKQRLEAMDPAQREALIDQAARVSETIDLSKVDPAKLNTQKMPSFDKTTQNLNEYEKKYKAGKINNPVVKPHR